MGFSQRSYLHDQFYSEVRQYLESCGYLTESSTYHDHWGRLSQEIIRTYFDPTALYVRFRADNTAIPMRGGGSVFQWDAKTNTSRQYANLALEAIPLAIHKALATQFGVKCLYACFDEPRSRHFGFWITDLPSITKAIIPTARWEQEQLRWFEQIIGAIFPGVGIQHRDSTLGSDTPFVIIGENAITQLPDWKILIPPSEETK